MMMIRRALNPRGGLSFERRLFALPRGSGIRAP